MLLIIYMNYTRRFMWAEQQALHDDCVQFLALRFILLIVLNSSPMITDTDSTATHLANVGDVCRSGAILVTPSIAAVF